MKKFFYILFILLFAQSIHAQRVYFQPEHHIGITGGPSASMVYFSPTVQQSFLMNYTTGIVYRYVNEKYAGLQVELNYSGRGWKESNDIFIKELDYIELPFMTHLYLGKKYRFYINIGPKIGYLIHEEILHQDNPLSTKYQHTQKVKNRFEYGAALGFGGLFKIQNQLISIEIRGNYSANGIYPKDSKEFFNNADIIHTSATVGWQLYLSDRNKTKKLKD